MRKHFAQSLAATGLVRLYDADKSYDTTRNAQANLEGRTHYVDPDTMRFHKARISKAVAIDDGLIFGIVESCSANYENTHRVHRPVFFDLDGNVIHRPDLEHSYKTGAQALKEFWRVADTFDAVAITRTMLESKRVALKATVNTIEEFIGDL